MTAHPSIIVVDYGVGNLYSLTKAMAHAPAAVTVSEEAADIARADGIILPGVGAYEAGMRGLIRRGLVESVRSAAARGVPILGICLGAQLLLTEGHEFGIFQGLDIIPGKVVHFPALAYREKVPHVGWNTVSPPEGISWDGTILDGMQKDAYVYFVHSYVMEPDNPLHCLSETTYGGHTFCSTMKSGVIFGCQFHPEKSGPVGAKILEQFVRCVAAR